MIEKIKNPLIPPVAPLEKSRPTGEESEEQARERREVELKKERESVGGSSEEDNEEEKPEGYKKIDIRV